MQNNIDTAKHWIDNINLDKQKGVLELMVDYADWVKGAPVEIRAEDFRKKVWAYYFKKSKQKYPASMIDAFTHYWGTQLPSGELRFEGQDKFSIGGRLATFSKSQQKIDENKRISEFKKALGQVNPLR